MDESFDRRLRKVAENTQQRELAAMERAKLQEPTSEESRGVDAVTQEQRAARRQELLAERDTLTHMGGTHAADNALLTHIDGQIRILDDLDKREKHGGLENLRQAA